MSIKDDSVNPSLNPAMSAFIERALARRTLLKAGLGAAVIPFLAACGSDGDSAAAAEPPPAPPPAPGPQPGQILATSVPKSIADTVVVPPGYTAEIVYRWGDPISSAAPDFRGDASQGWEAQEQQAGDNHDGMSFFPLNDANGEPRNDAGLLAMNHEYINPEYFYAPDTDPDNWLLPFTADKAKKALAAHGVSVVEVRRAADGSWSYVRDSMYNRRITGYTPMAVQGPAAGADALKTAADPAGTEVLGTLNNCANGETPWGTYLTCEENFNGYFGWNDPAYVPTDMENRYGLAEAGFGYLWHTVDSRFDVVATPNEPNRFGWIVEIDPYRPASKPIKRTALGRFKHENASIVVAPDGHVVAYMGDDERNEYIYKFVSAGIYDPANPSTGSNILDSGTLYVAKFQPGANPDELAGTGEWVALVHGQNGLDAAAGFDSQADILVNTRKAADVVGATMMDRPEWIAANPNRSGEIYCTLTNNNRRGGTTVNAPDGTTVAGSARPPVDAANPRADNVWGHIIRWNETGDDPASLTFDWDIFLLGGNAQKYPDKTDLRSGSASITPEVMFNSPDGLGFDPEGRLWIQTDGNYSDAGEYEGQGNNQMLVADVRTGELRRFLVGPSACEITGLAFNPDGTAMFVNVQHPGEIGGHPNTPKIAGVTVTENQIARQPTLFSTWPDGVTAERPRSATFVVRKDDGGVIGT